MISLRGVAVTLVTLDPLWVTRVTAGEAVVCGAVTLTCTEKAFICWVSTARVTRVTGVTAVLFKGV